MNNSRIQKVLDDNLILEQFSELLIAEINDDDEPLDKKGRHLCLTDNNADAFFIAICGWSVNSLLDKLNV